MPDRVFSLVDLQEASKLLRTDIPVLEKLVERGLIRYAPGETSFTKREIVALRAADWFLIERRKIGKELEAEKLEAKKSADQIFEEKVAHEVQRRLDSKARRLKKEFANHLLNEADND